MADTTSSKAPTTAEVRGLIDDVPETLRRSSDRARADRMEAALRRVISGVRCCASFTSGASCAECPTPRGVWCVVCDERAKLPLPPPPERSAEEWCALIESAPRIAKAWGAVDPHRRFFVGGKEAACVWPGHTGGAFARTTKDVGPSGHDTLDEAKAAADARLLADGVLLVGGPKDATELLRGLVSDEVLHGK